MKTLKIISLLLTYPRQEWVGDCGAMLEIIKEENWLPEEGQKNLSALIAYLQETDILDLQEGYVDLFDRTSSLSLHLFEHIHGDSRDRGAALVDLSDVYAEEGFDVTGGETPDYLPLFLEFLSLIEPEKAGEYLGDVVNVIGIISERLEKRESPYGRAFEALIEMGAIKPDKEAIAKALEVADGTASSLDDMDEAWEERPAFDGAISPDGSCPSAREMLARMNEDLPENMPKEAQK